VRRLAMAVYLLLANLTEDGRKEIEDFPERLKELNREIEFMGVKILAQYALLGQYDFVNIVEAANDETAAKLSIHLSARAGLRSLTLSAIPLDSLISILKKKQSPL
jgi:uncharacterized protein with GYD domain